MNTFNSTFEKYLSRTLQENLKPRQVWTQVAGAVDDKQILRRGQQFSKSTKNRVPVQPYVRNTDLTASTLTTAEEVLTVDQQPAFMFEIDDLDEFQSNVDLQDEYLSDSQIDLANFIDGEFLYENSLTAANVVDAGDIGGTAGEAIDLTGSNVFEVLSIAKRKLAERAVDMTDLYMVASPAMCQVIEEQVAARETTFGDEATRMGVKYGGGRTFMYNGIAVYENLNLPSTEVLNLATNPSDGDTIVLSINNVFEDVATTLTYTFVAVIGATPGNVLIGANADASRANLAGLMNDPSTTSATQVAFTGTDLWVANRLVATNDDVNDTLTIRLKGGRFSSVSETLTDPVDGFDADKQADNIVIGQRNCANIVIQKYPYVKLEDVQKQFAVRAKGNTLFGVKQFSENAKKAVRLDIKY